jgi:hypothetical protein
MLAFLKSLLPQPPVRTIAALHTLLSREAAFLAQRSVVDFARNELGSLSAQAFDDQRFLDKIAVCRWEGFAATLADMVALVHARLVTGADDSARSVIASRLGDLYAAMLADHPIPAHRAQGWDVEIAGLRSRLALRPAGPASPRALAEATGSMVFDTLPFAPRDPVENRMVVENAFAFGLISFNDRLARRLDAPALRGALAGSGG